MKLTNDKQQVRIWHPLIRIIHWLLVAIFTANYFILEAGSQWHQWLGYTAVSAVVLRIIWGFVDQSYGNFKTINLSQHALNEHLHHVKQRKIPSETGHNPLGWLMAFAVIMLFIGLGVTGFMMEEIDRFFGNETLEEIHEWFANILYAAVLVHIAAVIFTSWRGRIELIRPMITGKRRKN
ncbi:cytochrome b/b6 domain-containing protein [Pseudidiomarina homiensis]|uniref:Cytochrome B n=1 Tax=Pseudidiomarina homiensis TaxID=364198 RepID=A0A432XXT1_9GAMM|nr:cytochrome b/b6 domain-containing protein [Pseudidiomarina homiensis]RUO53519.1 cytochrome B [Pseudidiomarina homiensis]